MRNRKWLLGFMAVLALALAGCGEAGGSGSTPVHPQGTSAANAPTAVGLLPSSATQIDQLCPKGGGYMGCSLSRPSPTTTPLLTRPSASGGCKIPDVSDWQGHPNWDLAVHSGICGAIFKAGEFTTDPDAQFNSDALARLHLWHAIYWFVRNTGCSHEAAQIIAAAHAYRVKLVANDLEAPEAAGYAACLVPAEKAAHLIPVNYTSPGTWPGGAGFGDAPLWQAEYGPTLHALWTPVVAWQCTDGHFGCVTNIPGIGEDDVSVNLGITKLGGPVKPKDPYSIFSKQVEHFSYGISAGEHGTVATWFHDKCSNPVALHHPTCETLHFHAQLLRDRLLYNVKHHGGWNKYNRGPRYDIFQKIVGAF